MSSKENIFSDTKALCPEREERPKTPKTKVCSRMQDHFSESSNHRRKPTPTLYPINSSAPLAPDKTIKNLLLPRGPNSRPPIASPYLNFGSGSRPSLSEQTCSNHRLARSSRTGYTQEPLYPMPLHRPEEGSPPRKQGSI